MGLGLLEVMVRAFVAKPITFYLFKGTSDKDQYTAMVLDDNGIYRHHPAFMDSINSYQKNFYKKNQFLHKDPVSIYFLLSYMEVTSNNGQLDNSVPFYLEDVLTNDGISYLQFKEQLSMAFDSIDSPLLVKDLNDYTTNWINSDGFRSLELVDYGNTKKKILLLGDSFTYGNSAMPLHNSFADLILADGYVTYNLGIPGTNIINYYANAKKFISKVNPDYVFTFFFPVNDNIYFPWDSSNYHYQPGFIVEQGWLPSIVDSVYYQDKDEWKAALNSCFSKKLPLFFLRELAIYHVVVNKLFRKKISSCFPDVNQINEGMTNYYLKKIDQLCTINGTKHFIVVIPPLNMDMIQYELDTKYNIFKDLNVYYPRDFGQGDFMTSMGDPHFNNGGHKKMKDFVLKIIENNK